MKRQITSGYTFTPASGATAGSVNLSAVTGASFGALLGIINTTRNAPLYVAGLAGYGGSWTSGTLTLQASSQGHAAGDQLQIILDDGLNPALDATVQAVVSALAGTLTVSGSVTSTGGMQDSTGQSILAALKAQINIADLTYTDGAGNFYIRRETINQNSGAITVAWENPDGTAATPATPNALKPAAGSSRTVETVYFDATAAGTGYAAGDILARVVVFDVNTQAIVASVWHDVTTATTLASAPTAGTFAEQTKGVAVTAMPGAAATGAALEAGGNLAALATALGSQTSATAASPTAAAPLIGLIRLMAAYQATLAGAVANGRMQTAPQANAPSATTSGSVSAAGSAVTLPVDGFSAGSIQVTGTWSGMLSFLASPDAGTTFYPVAAVPMSGGTASVGTITGNGWWELAVGGMTHLQVVASAALTSGSATVALRATTGAKSMRVGTASGNPVATTGTAVALTDRSGTTSATAGAGGATQLAPVNAARQFLRVTNLASGSSTATLYLYDKATGTPSTTNSVPLAPGQSVTYDAKVPSSAIQVFSSGTSIAYEAAEG